MTDVIPPGSVATRGWRRWLAGALTAGALAALALFLFHQRDYIAEHYAPRPDAFIAIAVLTIASLALRGLANRALFRPLGIGASAFDWFRLVTVSSFTNYLPLSAGLVAKAFFLKRVHLLPYGTFAVGQLALLLVIIATNGAVGLATIALTVPPGPYTFAIGVGFALMASTAGGLYVPRSLLSRLPRSMQAAAIESAPAFRRKWPVVALLQVGILFASAACLEIAFDMGKSEVGFGACVVFTAAAMLTRLVSITPGAIGIREFLIGALAYLTGFELRDAVIASAATRTVEIAVVFALGGSFTRRFSSEVISSYDAD